jgi:hypothetical protein
VLPKHRVAEVFRRSGEEFLRRHGDRLPLDVRRVVRSLADCRTAALGGHLHECDRCGFQHPVYNSCRNRHCPSCLASARAKWVEARLGELLPVPYFHVVFTLPAQIAPIALQNRRLLYGEFFHAAIETLTTIAADPERLGARIGGLAVLHTWGQNLHHHPHVHFIVPGGGLSPDGEAWIPTRPGFFLPVRVLSRLFRRLFLERLVRANQRGKLEFHAALEPLRDPGTFHALVDSLRRRDWVVYAKKPFGGPRQVLAYLGRYTHGVAISDHRVLDLDDGHVRFRWKDYAHGSRKGAMILDDHEFLRRFLLHTLPKGFVRIRHFGLLANRHRRALLDLVRAKLASGNAGVAAAPPQPKETVSTLPRCPRCVEGHLRPIVRLEPVAAFSRTLTDPKLPP